ncbi:MAG: tRNA (N6-isopentenyl adenosine(37)-C2)-methylthiotransferase MiaB [Deltaproteobacteria bacterium]|nr:tRNA (N6-isopentenyl adenosine(37)-C2)-methylthiotransferase MiaB [Deltaproteobacteria bacterium]
MSKELKSYKNFGKKVYIQTFGCQMNENDSDRIIGLFNKMDYKITKDPSCADIIILNTCSIRYKAQHKVYSALGRFKDYKEANNNLIVGIGGCVAQQEGENLLAKIPHIDIVFGTHTIHKLPELIYNIKQKRQRIVSVELSSEADPEDSFDYPLEKNRVKTFVSIMRGCNNFCTYCIVPYVRGREVSRKSSDILSEIKRLAKGGIKEVMFVGQNVNSYGNNGYSDMSFPSLLKAVSMVDGTERIRFMTSHPKDISDELIDVLASEPKVCSHIHLPIQSGSDKILQGMRRGYTRKDYLEKIDRIRKACPDIAITTDIIVGFPGEAERDFDDTMDVIRTVEYDNIFSFNYSPRTGTEAAGYDEQVTDEIKAKRLSILQGIQKEITFKKNKAIVGKVVEVLADGTSKKDSMNEITGRTRCGRVVNFSGTIDLIGKVLSVRIITGHFNSLKGIIV